MNVVPTLPASSSHDRSSCRQRHRCSPRRSCLPSTTPLSTLYRYGWSLLTSRLKAPSACPAVCVHRSVVYACVHVCVCVFMWLLDFGLCYLRLSYSAAALCRLCHLPFSWPAQRFGRSLLKGGDWRRPSGRAQDVAIMVGLSDCCVFNAVLSPLSPPSLGLLSVSVRVHETWSETASAALFLPASSPWIIRSVGLPARECVLDSLVGRLALQ